MVYWVVGCTLWFNFALGALIPITPKLNHALAGVAFSAFVLVKIIVFVPAGIISDKIGHYRGFLIGLVSQALTLALIALFPDWVWLARGLEGVSLAFGTVAALSLLRVYSKDHADFKRSISLLMGIGSSGMLIGPFFGFTVEPRLALQVMAGVSALLIPLHLILTRAHQRAQLTVLSSPTQAARVAWPVLISFGLVKALAAGTQPLIGWWATEAIGLSKLSAGLSFVFLSVGFMLANWRPRWETALAGLTGLALIESSLTGRPYAWWPGLVGLGLFSGTMVNLTLSKLGWNNPEKIGLHNSKLMALSDLPMMVTPALFWELRNPSDIAIRLPVFALTAIAVLVLMREKA